MLSKHRLTWIASFPRSGNTWVRALISAYINEGVTDINSIMQTGDKDYKYYDGIVKAPISEWSMTDQALIKPTAMLRMLEDADGNLMLKTHDCNVDISGVAQIPHDISRAAIYIARDPRDIALSFKNHYNTHTLDAAVDKLLDAKHITRYPNKGLHVLQLSWQLHIASWLRELPYPVYILRYEDLLSKPFDILSDIVRFLQLEYDADIVNKSIEACDIQRFQQQEKKQGFREGVGQVFFHQGKAQRWRDELDVRLQERIKNACRKEMTALEYLD